MWMTRLGSVERWLRRRQRALGSRAERDDGGSPGWGKTGGSPGKRSRAWASTSREPADGGAGHERESDYPHRERGHAQRDVPRQRRMVRYHGSWCGRGLPDRGGKSHAEARMASLSHGRHRAQGLVELAIVTPGVLLGLLILLGLGLVLRADGGV